MQQSSVILELFMEHYRDYLKLAVMITQNMDGAQDVLQNVALVLCQKADELAGIENPGGYLTVCVRRCALNHIKSAARAFPTDPILLANFQPDTGDQITKNYIEWTIVLEKHLAAYSEELRRAFVLHYLDGYSLEQVAGKVNLTSNALSQQFKRMRERIAKQSPILSTLLMILNSL